MTMPESEKLFNNSLNHSRAKKQMEGGKSHHQMLLRSDSLLQQAKIENANLYLEGQRRFTQIRLGLIS